MKAALILKAARGPTAMFSRCCSRLAQSYMDFVRGVESSSPLSFLWLPFIPAAWIANLWIGWVDFLYRHGLKRVCEPPIPVISVGNLTYGGTNKTPFVEMLCRVALKKGVAAGIVSRGYGGENSDVLLLEGGRILEGGP
ncbi:MAG: tetraacyldisaccharide 4'-kinase, partial [Synergistaceae bacterium]|nr:tetraacyldisaccharide 4'-kinase [Synergistaceae bacterium]